MIHISIQMSWDFWSQDVQYMIFQNKCHWLHCSSTELKRLQQSEIYNIVMICIFINLLVHLRHLGISQHLCRLCIYFPFCRFHHKLGSNKLLISGGRPIGFSCEPLTTTLDVGFLHERPGISPWIKSISNELDIICHVLASQLSGHCDVISRM